MWVGDWGKATLATRTSAGPVVGYDVSLGCNAWQATGYGLLRSATYNECAGFHRTPRVTQRILKCWASLGHCRPRVRLRLGIA